MLLVDLREIRRGPVKLDLRLESAEGLLTDLECTIGGPVLVQGRLSESGRDQYYLAGRLDARITVACRRCLAAVPVRVATDIAALFAKEDSDDPAAYPLVMENGALDLGQMVREQLLLEAPEFALCRADCAGLCARCGKNLNEGPCTCEPEADPRWEGLAKLKARLTQSKEK